MWFTLKVKKINNYNMNIVKSDGMAFSGEILFVDL